MARKCLICEASITATQLGIDACRACAVFYRRARRTKRKIRCKGLRSGECSREGRIVDCRGCRFNRMREVFDKANILIDVSPLAKLPAYCNSEEATVDKADSSNPDEPPVSESIANSHLPISCPSTVPSTSSAPTTQVIDRIRSGYNLMTRIRRSSELSIRPLEDSVHPTAIANNTYENIPATHGLTFRTRRILQTALFDFASTAFPEFSTLNDEEKWLLVAGSCENINTLESTYRATKIYPNDGNIFISYTTVMCSEMMDYYLSDCPLTVNVEEATKELRKNLDDNVATCKSDWKRIDPSEEEFLVMVALSFWTTSDEALGRLATEIRTSIMHDLHAYYVKNGVTDYATRIGELFCLLIDNERITSNITEDYTLLGLINNNQNPRFGMI